MANSDRTAITALEPRTGTAASSGVGAVGERGRSGARGCAGGAGIGKGPGSAARGGARDVTDATRLKGASCESPCCAVPCRRRTVTERHDIVCVVLGLREQVSAQVAALEAQLMTVNAARLDTCITQ